MTRSPFTYLMADETLRKVVQSNQKALSECGSHSFDVPPEAFIQEGGQYVGIFPGTKFRCVRCNGRMPALEAFRYAEGVKAAGGDPNDVIPGFDPEPA